MLHEQKLIVSLFLTAVFVIHESEKQQNFSGIFHNFTLRIKFKDIFIKMNSLIHEHMKNVHYLCEFLSKNSNFVLNFTHISAIRSPDMNDRLSP